MGTHQSLANQFFSNEANCSGEDGDILEERTDMNIELDSGILNDTEIIKEGFRASIVNFKDKVLKRIDEEPPNYSKCVKSFTKQLKQCLLRTTVYSR